MSLITKIFLTGLLTFVLTCIWIGFMPKPNTHTTFGFFHALAALVLFFGSLIVTIGCLFAWIWI